MRRFRFGFDWCDISLREGYYDGPWWELNFLFFWVAWNLDGLPRMWQDREESETQKEPAAQKSHGQKR